MPSREPTSYAHGPEPAPAAPVQQQQLVEISDTDVGPAMRASSWGDVGEYGRLLRAHEAASMHSGAGDHEEEPLDPDVVVVGAGGVALGPLPPTPSGSAGVLAALAGSYSVAHLDAAANAGAMCHQAPQVSSYSSEGDVDVDGSDGDSDSFFARNSQDAARARLHLNPHAHVHAGCRVGDEGDEDGDGNGGWGFNGIGAARRAKGALYGPSVGVDVEVEEECDYEEEDEDDDEGSDGLAIEVRRRRPSWAVHHDEHEPDYEDDEKGPPPESPPPLREAESDGDEP